MMHNVVGIRGDGHGRFNLRFNRSPCIRAWEGWQCNALSYSIKRQHLTVVCSTAFRSRLCWRPLCSLFG